ncbi:MAG: TetR/AcrR family transcriptional regulator [Pseudomonadota bacterium]
MANKASDPQARKSPQATEAKPLPMRVREDTSKRDASKSKRAILDAALIEFSMHGYAGARVDAIAGRAGVSKPLIYTYFGDKAAIYAAALREAYVQIRLGERQLNLDDMDPETAIRALVTFTLKHFREKPWFVSMLNTENLRGGGTVREIEDVGQIQSNLLIKLQALLERGVEQGAFRPGITATELYISIASLCYFPISNAHTLRAVFDVPVDDAWLEKRGSDIGEMVIRFLRPDAP